MANKYGYQVHKQSEHTGSETRHVSIDIIRLDTSDAGRGDRVLEFAWQAGIRRQDEDRYWYGLRFKPAGVDSHERLNEVSRLAKRLIPKDTGWFYYTPEDLVNMCVRKRIPRVWYDSRLSRYVKLADIPDLDLDRWLALDSSGRCTVDCLAFDETAAKKLLVLEFANQIANSRWRSGDMEKKLEYWLSAGQPMKNASQQSWGQTAPEIIETSVLLQLDETVEVVA